MSQSEGRVRVEEKDMKRTAGFADCSHSLIKLSLLIKMILSTAVMARHH